MNQRGFTLTELLTVITIMGILMAIAALSYTRWNAKAEVEREAREMLADFSSYRIKAMQTKLPFRVFLNQNSYQVRYYESMGDIANGLAGTPAFDKTLRYPIQRADGTAFNNFPITFDISGVARDGAGNTFNPPAPLVVVVTHDANINAVVDCVSIDNIQTKMGIFGNATCTPQ